MPMDFWKTNIIGTYSYIKLIHKTIIKISLPYRPTTFLSYSKWTLLICNSDR